MSNVGRHTNYQDPPELARGVVAYDDPIERAGLLAHRMTFSTPADAVSDLSSPSGRERMKVAWLALAPARRQLWRRRADETAQAYLTPIEFLQTIAVEDLEPVAEEVAHAA